MFEPFARADQRRWGGAYLRGLLLDGGRKSVEPMAARLGEEGNRQALAHFVTSSPWDAAHVRARLAWRMQPVIKPTALVIDDTGFLKDGDASACVTRQYTGTRPTHNGFPGLGVTRHASQQLSLPARELHHSPHRPRHRYWVNLPSRHRREPARPAQPHFGTVFCYGVFRCFLPGWADGGGQRLRVGCGAWGGWWYRAARVPGVGVPGRFGGVGVCLARAASRGKGMSSTSTRGRGVAV
ncbi:transposase (plasmid) [Streptomyces globisporus]|uniref:transposase n=1 Tax=Streptomyces globisporus TaxID=1908 RepID=UPI002F90803B|nr:transposase [Streptomyces globisporus]